MATWQQLRKATLSLIGALALFASSSAQVIGGGGPNQYPTMSNIHVNMIDYQGNVPATDRNYHSQNQIHPAIEYINDPELELIVSVPTIVYTKGTLIQGQTTVKNTTGKLVGYTLLAQPGTFTSEAPNEDQLMGFPYEVRPVSYSVSSPMTGTIPNGGTVTFSWTANGVPDFLCAGYLDMPAKLRLTFPTEPGSSEDENDISMANIALSKMVSTPLDVMQIPWADFAYEVGLWGWGANTTEEAKHNLTYGIHYSNRHPWNRLVYDSSTYRYYNPTNLSFRMKLFLNRLDWYIPLAADCQDFASLFSYSMESNGVDVQLRRLQAEPWFDGQQFSASFLTNLLCPAGSDSTQFSPGFYQNYGFNFHMVGFVGDQVFDCPASHKFDLLGLLHLNPVDGWPMPLYWQTTLGGLVQLPKPHDYDLSVFNTDRQAHELS